MKQSRPNAQMGPYTWPDFVNLDDPRRSEVLAILGRYISECLYRRGITEEEIQKDFDTYRQRRRAGE